MSICCQGVSKPGTAEGVFVNFNELYYRPTEAEPLLRHPTKSQEKLSWGTKISLVDISARSPILGNIDADYMRWFSQAAPASTPSLRDAVLKALSRAY